MEMICHKACDENEHIVKNVPSGNLIRVKTEAYGQEESEFLPSYTLHSRLCCLLSGSIPWCFVNFIVSHNSVTFCMFFSLFPQLW